MRWLLLPLLFVGACGMDVKQLDLHDPRLPGDARRWLADAEDEVAIGRSRVIDATAELEAAKNYRELLSDVLSEKWSTGKSGAKNEGKEAASAIDNYAEARVEMKEKELAAAMKMLGLAKMRLTQARAETAVRYDIAVYDLPAIAKDVELLKKEVAASERVVEELRAKVEKRATTVWKKYSKFVGGGGNSNALWGLRIVRRK